MIPVTRLALVLVLLAVGLTAGPRDPAAAADASLSFLFDPSSAGDDSQYFLSLAVTNAGYPRSVIEPLVPRIAVVESDLPVVLFLARRCDCPPDRIVVLREQGLQWGVIFQRVGVPIDVLFTGMDRDPGPPYGHAWGYWRKHGRRSVFGDPDVVSLVELQTARAITGRPVVEIVRLRGSGRSTAWVVAESRDRHERHEAQREAHGERSDHGHHGRGGRR